MLFNPSDQTRHAYFIGYHRAMFKYHGRPHWGKHLNLNHEEVKVLYPKLEGFLAMRKKMDPQNVFVNNMTASLFEL